MGSFDIKAYTDFGLTIGDHPIYVIKMHLGLGVLRAHVRDIDVLLFLGNTLFIDYRVMGANGSKPFLLEYRS